MALTDTLSGSVKASILCNLKRSSGLYTGNDVLSHDAEMALTDGSGANQASGWFGTTFTATTGGITISLADSADPLGAAGDDVPTSDPEGLKLRGLLIQNMDTTNFVTVKRGTNGESSMLTGATDGIKITAGGILLWTSPSGVSAMTDTTDDELLCTADTASCSVKITYLFG